MCMSGNDDFWDFYNEYTPKARKEQTCGECGRTIGKGERYHTQGGKSEGNFLWYKTCAHCAAASRWLEVVCEGWVFERREEDFMEHVVGEEKYVRSRALVRLVRWMRADWRDRDGHLRPVDEVKVVTGVAIASYKHQQAQDRRAA
jgi:hypothetical protein